MAIFALSGRAQAYNIISYSDSYALHATAWDHNLTVNKFNASLGTLDKIVFTLSAQAIGTYKIENLSLTTPVTIRKNSTFGVGVDVTIPGSLSASTLSVAPILTVAANTPLTVFDGTKDYAGTSGRTYTLDASDLMEMTLLSTAMTLVDKSLFIGSGIVSFIGTADSLIGFNYNGGTPEAVGTAQASEFLTVDYYYTPSPNPPTSAAPEPGTIMLLSTGLLGLGGSAFFRRRRKTPA